MSVYNPEAFHERVTHAQRCLLSGATQRRHFETCFAMWDGDAVAVALSRRLIHEAQENSARDLP